MATAPRSVRARPQPVALAASPRDAGAQGDTRISETDAAAIDRSLPNTRSAPAPIFTETRNLLLIGLDARAGHRSVRADTIIIAILDETTSHLGLISIPRDLYVDIEGEGEARINSIPGIAKRRHEEWLPLMEQVVETVTGVPIANTLAIDMEMLERATDALGGIDVIVPCPIEDSFIDARTETGRRKLHVLVGTSHMDGVTAAMYARSRHGRSDWDRARRQQAILSAFRARVSEPSGAFSAFRFLPEALDLIETNLDPADALHLARYAMRVRPEHLHGMVLSSRATESFTTADAQHVLRPIPDAVRESIAQVFDAPHPGTPRTSRCQESDVALQHARDAAVD